MRSFDGERLNFLVNHPAIRPTAGGDGQSYIDIGRFAEDPANHFLDEGRGGLFFHWCAPDTYEVHIFVLPEGRGKWAYRFADAGLAYMIGEEAIHLWARVPADSRQMDWFTRRLFVLRGTRTFDLGAGPVLYSIFDWRR